MHADLVTVLKRCQKGNQSTFTLLRQPQEVRGVNIFTLGGGVNSLYTRGDQWRGLMTRGHYEGRGYIHVHCIYKKCTYMYIQCTCVTLWRGVTGFFLLLKYADFNGQDEYPQYLGPDGYPAPANHTTNEPFTLQEIRLMRQVSGFGFRIIGGKEEGSQVRGSLCSSAGNDSTCTCICGCMCVYTCTCTLWLHVRSSSTCMYMYTCTDAHLCVFTMYSSFKNQYSCLRIQCTCTVRHVYRL